MNGKKRKRKETKEKEYNNIIYIFILYILFYRVYKKLYIDNYIIYTYINIMNGFCKNLIK